MERLIGREAGMERPIRPCAPRIIQYGTVRIYGSGVCHHDRVMEVSRDIRVPKRRERREPHVSSKNAQRNSMEEAVERRFDEQTSRRLLLCLEGLSTSATICRRASHRLNRQLATLEENFASGAKSADAIDAIADAWSIVEATHRYRVILQSTPGFQRKAPHVRLFLDATSSVEDLRHYAQHMGNEINRHAAGSPPLWGALSWASAADPATHFTLMIGGRFTQAAAAGLVVDTHRGVFVRQMELSAGKSSIDLAQTASRVEDLDTTVQEWTTTFKLSDGNTFEYRPKTLPLIQIGFSQRPKAPQDQ